MNVLTVGCCLRFTVNWSSMWVFTLMQSRSYVDTVQTVLHGIINSRHICWSHTMKVLGSRVTFVRRNSAANNTSKYTFSDMEAVKPYVCSECPKRFCTADELRNHHPVHSEYKQFSCGLCDRLYKRKMAVKIHFRKCSAKHGVTYVRLWRQCCVTVYSFSVYFFWSAASD